MYGYEEYTPLTIENILARVEQEDIYAIVIGERPIPYKYVTSHLREDTSPRCWFEWFDNILWFVDFSSSPKNITCFHFIAKYYNISYYESLHFVNNHFKLGLGYSESVSTATPLVINNHERIKQYCEFRWKAKPFTIQDRNYWIDYEITSDNLIEDGVFSVKSYEINGRIQRPLDVCYAITIEERVKFYRPNSKTFKFRSNFTPDDIGNFHSLDYNLPYVLITKSYKDYRVLVNQGLTNTIWFQSENMFPTDEEKLSAIRSFKYKYVFFDNDDAGIKGSTLACNLLDGFPIFIDNKNFKDPAEYKKAGLDLWKYLKFSTLLGTHM